MRSDVQAGFKVLIFGLLVTLGLIVTQTTSVTAQENLYGPSAPPDAAYLRIVNAAAETDGVEATVGEVSYGPVAFTEASAYAVVPPGDLTLQVGGMEQALMVEPGDFYTVAVTPEGMTVVNDEPLIDASRALLTLYNFTSQGELDLKTADGTTDIVTGVAPGAADSIVVNQAQVPLTVFSGGEPVGELGPQLLERGVAYSVFVFERDGAKVVSFAAAELQE